MFKNVETNDGAVIHSIPMDLEGGAWKDSSDHILSEHCPCSPKRVEYIKPAYGDFFGEIYNHYRRQKDGTVTEGEKK